MLLVKRQVHLSASAKVHEKPVCCGTEIHQRASRQLLWDLSAVTASPLCQLEHLVQAGGGCQGEHDTADLPLDRLRKMVSICTLSDAGGGGWRGRRGGRRCSGSAPRQKYYTTASTDRNACCMQGEEDGEEDEEEDDAAVQARLAGGGLNFAAAGGRGAKGRKAGGGRGGGRGAGRGGRGKK